MPSKKNFIASLFVFALCAFTIAGLNLYKNIDYKRHARQATMELADPGKKVILFDDAISTRTIDVRFVGDEGEVVVPQKVVPKEIADQLIAGQKISVTYLANNHQRAYYRNPDLPNPWIWLIVGVIVLATAIYALRLRKRELEE